MMRPKHLSFIVLSWVLLAACTSPPSPGPTAGLTPSLQASPTITPDSPATPTPPEVVSLTIWVPPPFDPASGDPAGDLFQARLEAFSEQFPRVRLTVRVKAETGTAGLLSSLTAAHAAAPLALPDIIALPRSDLETAAIKGLILPIDRLSTTLDEEDWFGFARQLVHLQEDNFGLPFAGDAMVLLYRPSQVGDPPPDLEAVLQLEDPLAFPAASPRALFPLALYRASGGTLEDEENRPHLDAPSLTSVLAFFQSAAQTGVLPFWLTQYDTEDQALQAYMDNQADLAVAWSSRYLADPPIDTVVAHLPTPQGSPFTLARGWTWALSATNPNRQEASIALMEFLTEPAFLGEWTRVAGYLPTRSRALEAWPDSPVRSLVEEVIGSAELLPPADLLSAIGPALQGATIEVLKDQADPAEAARTAVEQLSGP